MPLKIRPEEGLMYAKYCEALSPPVDVVRKLGGMPAQVPASPLDPDSKLQGPLLIIPRVVLYLTRTPQCLAPKQAWYSFIDPLKEGIAELTLPSPRFELQTYGEEARYTTTQ
ncbi:hypothetical protein TNCV_3165011 [Trichonephila clavipes]|nr:hypothetical protein TNCV_3165011 [Trichonephila clavipes]